MNYCDPQVTVEQTNLRRRHYNFPPATTKSISVDRIESIQVGSLTFRTANRRACGSTTVKSWMPLDDAHQIATRITRANPNEFIAGLKAPTPKAKVSQRK
jgi:hypothetical protein